MELNGIKICDGIAIGITYIYRPFVPSIYREPINADQVENQIKNYQEAKKEATSVLNKDILSCQSNKKTEVDILLTHKMMLLDPDIDESILKLIHDCYSASNAIDIVFSKRIKELDAVSDKRIRERTADLKEVENRLLSTLEGNPAGLALKLSSPSIVVCPFLPPSVAALADESKVLAFIAEEGSETSHAAIIAKAKGIPTVFGVKNILRYAKENSKIGIDATNGTIYLSLSEEITEKLIKKNEFLLKRKEENHSFLVLPAYSLDKKRIQVCLNLSSTRDESLAQSRDVDGCGLLRTEFLFMERDSLPSEEEQYQAYAKTLKTFDHKPVVIRTLDIGGDKPLSYLNMSKELNPFLGERAIRYCFNHEELFEAQIKALLRAGVYGDLYIMFPMISSLDDIDHCVAFVKRCMKELDQDKIPYSKNPKIGIMIEIPSIAILSTEVASRVDFASIGTNDLCQYTLAVDRSESSIKSYYQTFNPGFLRLIKTAISGFKAAKKPIGICGELGGNPIGGPLLIGMGASTISMSHSCIGNMKRILSKNEFLTLTDIAETSLNFSKEEEVLSYLYKNIKGVEL